MTIFGKLPSGSGGGLHVQKFPADPSDSVKNTKYGDIPRNISRACVQEILVLFGQKLLKLGPARHSLCDTAPLQ